MTPLRLLILGLVWLAGILSIIASSFEDQKPVIPPVAVTVDFTASSLSSPLQRSLDTRSAELTGMNLNGSYAASQGDKLTLDRSSIALDSGSRFDLSIAAMTADELLEGDLEFRVTALFDVGLSHNPVAGQFSSLYAGTTTIATATGSAVDVIVGGAAVQSFGWSAFSALEDDNDASLDLRAASAAYNMIEVVLRSILVAEDAIDDIEANKTLLEGMNINTTLSISCDNATNDGDGQARLIWTSDATGSGQGAIGNDDAFEARYDNCLDNTRAHFLDGVVVLDNYDADNDTGLGTYGIEAELRNLFLADEPVDLDTTPGPASAQINGQLSLLYSESLLP